MKSTITRLSSRNLSKERASRPPEQDQQRLAPCASGKRRAGRKDSCVPMVLHPIDSPNSKERRDVPQTIIPAWEAVERKQKQTAQEWWLIAQPDHAALSGDLAALVDTPLIPELDDSILHARLHDPRVDANGRPLSFLQIAAADFVIAWEESIQKASEVSQVGGFMVSEHFCRLARSRLETRRDPPPDQQRLTDLLAHESKRRAELQIKELRLEEQLALLTDVLQFCDLLSLYLCSGADDTVEFPQSFGERSITIKKENGIYQLSPQLFPEGASLGVTARRFPHWEVGTLAFLIQ